jgi:hypothetical protein
MPGFQFWQRWLLAVAIAVAAFGAFMALLSGTPLFDLFNRQIDPAFCGANTIDASRAALLGSERPDLQHNSGKLAQVLLRTLGYLL